MDEQNELLLISRRNPDVFVRFVGRSRGLQAPEKQMLKRWALAPGLLLTIKIKPVPEGTSIQA
jgi:hypothetical protein